MSNSNMTSPSSRITKLKSSNARVKEISGVHSLFFGVIIAILAVYFFSALSLKSGSTQVIGNLGEQLNCDDKAWATTDLLKTGQKCPSVDELILDIQNIEASVKKNLIANIRIWPAGELGSAIVNTGFTSVPLHLGYESLNIST